MTENIDSKINLSNENQEINSGENPKSVDEVEGNQASPKKERPRKFSKSKKIALIVSLSFLGFSLASCQKSLSAEELRRIETGGDDSPQVQRAYQIYLENKNQENQENTNDNLGLNAPEPFEIPASNQTIRPGSRVRVIETGGYGLNIRSEVGTDANLVTNAGDGTIFKVIEFAGEKDGYHWVLVKSEAQEGELEVVGYAVVDWFQVLNDAPVQ